MKQTNSLVRVRRSEYGDEVTKMNRKEDMMLGKRLRVLERQERIAESILRKHVREAERLKHDVLDRSRRGVSLHQYDFHRNSTKPPKYTYTQKRRAQAHRHNSCPNFPGDVTLPPIAVPTSPRNLCSPRDVANPASYPKMSYDHGWPATSRYTEAEMRRALSLRALRDLDDDHAPSGGILSSPHTRQTAKPCQDATTSFLPKISQ